MAKLVYILCALTSIGCAGLLIRAYGRKPTRLLLWSGIGFSALAASNILLVADLVIFPDLDLMLWRNLATLAGLISLMYGLVGETL
jgi:hypothetical protein